MDCQSGQTLCRKNCQAENANGVHWPRAVIIAPDVELADEPTGNVDWEMSLRLLRLLIELNKMGKTIPDRHSRSEPDPRRQDAGRSPGAEDS